MADRTTINYVDASWNPVAGCTPVSAGCAHCFAARYAARHIGAFADGPPFSTVRTSLRQLEAPLRWRRPRTILVPTLGDLFHPDVSDEWLVRVFHVMGETPQHTYLVLTKRPQRMWSFVSHWDPEDQAPYPLPNLWLGVSVEDQATADKRIPILLQTPAAHRWVSYEPALGPVNLREMAHRDDWSVDALDTPDPTRRLDWVVVGGETGPGARACRLEWIADVIEQCRAAGVPVWVKQLGARSVGDAEGTVVRQRPGGLEVQRGNR